MNTDKHGWKLVLLASSLLAGMLWAAAQAALVIYETPADYPDKLKHWSEMPVRWSTGTEPVPVPQHVWFSEKVGEGTAGLTLTAYCGSDSRAPWTDYVVNKLTIGVARQEQIFVNLDLCLVHGETRILSGTRWRKESCRPGPR